MSVNLSQFHQVFFEESVEGLDAMESALVELDAESCDTEALNSIFRAAHSIKGGAGTFGFEGICDFTHVLETLLDQIRARIRPMRPDYISLLLEAVDCLRELLLLAQEGKTQKSENSIRLHKAFEQILDQGPTMPEVELSAEMESSTITNAAWEIHFQPHPEILQSGNDPLRILRELAGLGEVTVQCNTSSLPSFEYLDPQTSYLHWNIIGLTGIALEEINEVFEWVSDECELTIASKQESNNVSAPFADKQSAANVPPPTEATPTTSSAAPSRTAENTFIRVGIDKIDLLINMVGELVITQSMLGQISNEIDISKLPRLMEGLSQLEQNTRELQDGVMRIRMLPISFTFNRFPRLVKDLGQKLDKKIILNIRGEQTELDKTVMEKIGDPLVHLVRNAIDHGIESPKERLAKGKDETGTIFLNAYHKGGDVVIVIRDDGAGLDRSRIAKKALEKRLITQDQAESFDDGQIFDLIFEPGFSTASEVTDVSGRGVGMDVVRKNIQALNGTVEIDSATNEGSTITIRLPLTLAILDGQLVRVNNNIYIFPLVSIVESMQCKKQLVNCLAGGQNVFRLRDEYVPVIELSSAFGLPVQSRNIDGALMVVVEADGVKAGVIVDELLSQQQVVIKSLEQNYKKVEGVSGATILGDGAVALIVDVQNIVKLCSHKRSAKVNFNPPALQSSESDIPNRLSSGI